MRVCREIDFNDLQNMVWSGAEDTVENIANASMEDELMGLLEETFMETVPTETEINDFLWFDSEYIYETLGLNEDGEVEEEDEESDIDELIEDTIKRMEESNNFESFCGDCEECALNIIKGTMARCERLYNAYNENVLTSGDIADIVRSENRN